MTIEELDMLNHSISALIYLLWGLLTLHTLHNKKVPLSFPTATIARISVVFLWPVAIASHLLIHSLKQKHNQVSRGKSL